MLLLGSRFPRSSFPDHVLHVVGLGPEEQMVGIAARWVVALVAYQHPLRDGSVSRLESDSMGVPMSAQCPVISVPPRQTRSDVGPTRTLTPTPIYPAKDRLNRVGFHPFHPASGGTKSHRVIHGLAGGNGKSHSAGFTNTTDAVLGAFDRTESPALTRVPKERDAAILANKNGHNKTPLWQSVSGKVGRGPEKPLVTGGATPSLAPFDCRPIIPLWNGTLSIAPVLNRPLGEEE